MKSIFLNRVLFLKTLIGDLVESRINVIKWTYSLIRLWFSSFIGMLLRISATGIGFLFLWFLSLLSPTFLNVKLFSCVFLSIGALHPLWIELMHWKLRLWIEPSWSYIMHLTHCLRQCFYRTLHSLRCSIGVSYNLLLIKLL